MPDSKITALTALTAADPANDMIPIVDVSDTPPASGNTKRISINNILACSPTATLASATITGDLTVDTSTLKVDSANNRVGIGTATPAAVLHVVNGNVRLSDSAQVEFGGTTNSISGSNASNLIEIYTNNLRRNRIDSNGVATWSNVGGVAGDAMTLNSTGLGVGVSPLAKIHSSTNVAAANFDWTTTFTAPTVGLLATSNNSSAWIRIATLDSNPTHDPYVNFLTSGGQNWSIGIDNSDSDKFKIALASGFTGSNEFVTIDTTGNVLIGTTTNAGVRLDVQTTTGNCIGRVKSNAAASTASFIIDYVETLGCTYIKKAGSDVWIYGVQNDTSATPAFKINTASNVGVQLVSGATAWTTLSDETVKDIIEPISNAVAKVGSIRSVIGKFKTDDSSKRRSFLIAQDVQSVLPEAVDVVGENNELGLRYTEVIPLLVAAIKELTAEVNALKNA